MKHKDDVAVYNKLAHTYELHMNCGRSVHCLFIYCKRYSLSSASSSLLKMLNERHKKKNVEPTKKYTGRRKEDEKEE